MALESKHVALEKKHDLLQEKYEEVRKQVFSSVFLTLEPRVE